MLHLEEGPAAPSLAVLPNDVMEMVLRRLPLPALLDARCVCRRWRDLIAAPQFLQMRRRGPAPRRTTWLFLFGLTGDVVPAPAPHVLDVAARRLGAAGLRGRCLLSVAAIVERQAEEAAPVSWPSAAKDVTVRALGRPVGEAEAAEMVGREELVAKLGKVLAVAGPLEARANAGAVVKAITSASGADA